MLWEDLDRILDYKDPWGGWAKRKLLELAEAIAEHLGMVFHRFLTGEAGHKLEIMVNGSMVDAWDPFCRGEQRPSASRARLRVAAEKRGHRARAVICAADKIGVFERAAWQRASGPSQMEPATGPLHLPGESPDPVGRLEPHADHR